MFTRVPTNRSPGRRRPVMVVALVAVGVYLLLTAAGTLWTDFLWFSSLGFGPVWMRNWGLSILLGSVGVVFTFGLLWASLHLADRLSPRYAAFDLSAEEELVERFREWVEPRVRQVRLIVSGALALMVGVAPATWRDEVFLFLNGGTFGTADPIFNADYGFYMFRLPLWQSAVGWLFSILVLVGVVVAVAHYLNGGIRFDGRRLSTSRGAKVHISVMLATIALVRAGSYRLEMFELLFGQHQRFSGASYTDINARLPVLQLLLVVALIAAVLFIINTFRRGWTLAAVSVGSWIVVSIAAGAIYPALIERFRVQPNQLAREMPYISHNLEATRAAYLFDQVEVRPFAAAEDLTAEDIAANRLTIDNLRIWNTAVLPRTYQNFQELAPFYSLDRVATDRYLNEDTPQQVMLSVRELDEANLPRDDWQNQRLFYTHGFGAVVNQANVVQSDGQPQFLLRDIPAVATDPVFELEEPRVYFGETYQPGRPVFVRTGAQPQEIDFPLAEGGTAFNEYSGGAGVPVDNLFKRIAFAFRYRDLNLLISGEIRSDSRVLVERNIRSKVENVAPFLITDADPYPVILDGRILWVLDMYTTSTRYPYSTPLTSPTLQRVSRTSSLTPGTNYIRNSVKGVIDAYDGSVDLFVFDESDPVIRAWQETHPELFRPASDMPEGLQAHLRYPQDLFRVQSDLYLEYHVETPTELFQGNDAWSLPEDPSTINRLGPQILNGDGVDALTGAVSPMRSVLPYYLLTNLPGEEDLSYLLLQPFNPRERRNMVGFLVADSNPDRYGRLIDFRMPRGKLVDGTAQVGQRIEQDGDIAQQLSLWRGQGSNVFKGDLLVVPIGDSVIYLQPFFLEEEGGAFPEFRRVAVVYGEQVVWADTLDGSLSLIFGEGIGDPVIEVEEPDLDDEEEPTVIETPSTVEDLIAEARQAFANADQALREGDLAGYQRWVEEASRLLEEIEEIVTGSAEASGLHIG